MAMTVSGSAKHALRRLFRLQSLLLVSILVIVVLTIHVFHVSDRLPVPSTTERPFFVGQHHPLELLIESARAEFADVVAKQSDSLREAVGEYERRYRRSPPPHFDKWYAYARKNEVPLIDEFDGIYEVLRPFWGLAPVTVRARVQNALNADESLIVVSIRDGQIDSIDRGPEWKQDAVRSSIEPFAELLPDMHLAVNSMDEARVVIPYDQMTQLLDRAAAKEGAATPTTQDQWSSQQIEPTHDAPATSRHHPFIQASHQFTWSTAILSCPPDSPARQTHFDGTDSADQEDFYGDNLPLGFIRNRTAFTDICLTPSLGKKQGIFNQPNTWSVTHDAIPIFSPSKTSCFSDILFPAPWYLGDQTVYDERQDIPWLQKRDVLYWRGSTTSGYSAKGTWHIQGRQRFVETVEKPGRSPILKKSRWNGHSWQLALVEREALRSLFDVHFSHVGQCSEEDCEEQEEYFDVRPSEAYEKNWESKFLLDIDGNAYSGRFYTFLRSQSLTLKSALFREWHEDRVRPWVHYIPLGVNGSDHYEIMRWLTQDEDGMRLGREIAAESKIWADRSLRHVDMHAWMFRLLLEYGRLIDDNRDNLGFRL